LVSKSVLSLETSGVPGKHLREGREGTGRPDRREIEERLDDLGELRFALLGESGVDGRVPALTTPALHNLEPEKACICHGGPGSGRRNGSEIPSMLQDFATLAGPSPRRSAGILHHYVLSVPFTDPATDKSGGPGGGIADDKFGLNRNSLCPILLVFDSL
jgi:hypothetical protein